MFTNVYLDHNEVIRDVELSAMLLRKMFNTMPPVFYTEMFVRTILKPIVDIRPVPDFVQQADAYRASEKELQDISKSIEPVLKKIRQCEDLPAFINSMLAPVLRKEENGIWSLLLKMTGFLMRYGQNAADMAEQEGSYEMAMLRRTKSSFERPYIGKSLDAFIEHTAKINRTFKGSESYGRIMSTVQSSGVGKSKLFDELGKRVLLVGFCLRENGETGYPPGDPEILSYLKGYLGAAESFQTPAVLNLHAHTRAISLILAVLQIGKCNLLFLQKHFLTWPDVCSVGSWYFNWKKENPSASLSDIAAEWRRLMCCVEDFPARFKLFGSDGNYSSKISELRSQDKKKFCKDAVQLAGEYSKQLLSDSRWTVLFLDSGSNLASSSVYVSLTWDR
jgi:hypothetical protein